MRVRTKREASATITKIWVGRGFYGKEKLVLSENMCMVHFLHEVKFQNLRSKIPKPLKNLKTQPQSQPQNFSTPPLSPKI